jgi:hypothetical protein
MKPRFAFPSYLSKADYVFLGYLGDNDYFVRINDYYPVQLNQKEILVLSKYEIKTTLLDGREEEIELFRMALKTIKIASLLK